MRRSVFIISLLFLTVSESAFAQSCWTSASERFAIHESILHAIARTESAMNPKAINRNTNGSVDVGLMQINSRWFPHLAALGVEPGDLWDGCTSIHVGAWILAGYVSQFGYNWRAIGAYNAGPSLRPGSEEKRRNYAERVYQNMGSGVAADYGLYLRHQYRAALPH